MPEILLGNIKGEKGDAGTGLKILEHYDNDDSLLSGVLSCNAGDAYSVGTETPYDIYIFIRSLWVL